MKNFRLPVFAIWAVMMLSVNIALADEQPKGDCNGILIPYVNDFENETAGVQPACWTFSSTTSIAGNASAKYLSLNGTSGTAYAITPRLAKPANEVMISFYEQEHTQYGSSWGAYGPCVIGTITDPSDTSTFTALDTLPASWEKYRRVEYFLYNAPSTDYYIMFKYNGYNAYAYGNSYCYIDSVQIDSLPTCFPVKDIRLDTVYATRAKFSWTPGKDEQAWNVLVLSTNGDTLYNKTVATNHCTVRGFRHRTPYSVNVSVRANCGNGDLSRITTATFSFETPINCGSPIVTLPFIENFESTSAETQQMPSCWTKIVRPTGYDIYPYVYSNYSYCHSCDNTLYISGYHYGIYTILPEFSMDVNKLQISLWTRNSLVDPTHGSFIIGAISNPNDSTTFFPIDTLPQSTDFTEHLVYLDQVPAGYKYIAILYDRFTSGSSWLVPTGMIDDVTVDYCPTCLAIEDIKLDSVGPNDATFSWTPKRPNPYGFEVTITNEYDGTVLLSDTVLSPTIQISGLDFSSEYKLNVSVATICTPGNSAEPYTESFFIKTECKPIESLYNESFEHFVAYPYQTEAVTTPNCWNVINANSRYYSQRIYVTNNSSFVHAGKQSLIFEYSMYYPSYAIMPEMNVDLSTQQISFFYKLIDSYRRGDLTLGYFPKDRLVDSAFVALTKVSGNRLKDYRLENVPEGARLAFKYYNPNMPQYEFSRAGIAIDDITIEDINNCHPPLRVRADSVTSHSVRVHWQPEFEDNTHFNVTILQGKDTLFYAEEYPDTLCVIEGLPYAKYYSLDCHISTACGDRTSDPLQTSVYFVTECAPFAIPYQEDFEHANTTYVAGHLPYCWEQWGHRQTGLRAWGNPTSYSTHSGGGILDLFADSTSWSMVALPEFEASVDTLSISFYSKTFIPDDGEIGTLEVGYLPNPADSSTFVSVASISGYEEYTLSTVDFQNAPEDIHVMAFRYSGGNMTNEVYIDDITVESNTRKEVTKIETVEEGSSSQATKFIRNGQLFILRDGRVYTIFGTIIEDSERDNNL